MPLTSNMEAIAALSISKDALAKNYGDVPFSDAITGRKWTKVKSLTSDMKDQTVLIRGRVHLAHAVSSRTAFVVVRDDWYTVQCVLVIGSGKCSKEMMRFATTLSRESIVDVEGIISVCPNPIKSTTQQVEIQVRKIYCINRAKATLPMNLEDASRSEAEYEQALKEQKPLVRVNQDTRLNCRVLDLRTLANQAIFHLSSKIEHMFRVFLVSEGFVGIHTPKLMKGTSEGGAAVFRLDYKGQPACLAQSPQLHKQMTVGGDFKRVFEVGPVFRAEDSYTHRHLCEFTGLDAEMEIIEHYSEVMDIVDRLFVSVFDELNENCKEELGAISRQYPFTPLKYLRKTLQLTFQEGVQLLKEAGVDVDPHGDLSTQSERMLGELVRERYDTEFFILHKYPLAVRPFYTMPCRDDPSYSNSFDVFLRGEEIISGAQRIHDPAILEQRAKACGIDVMSISFYLDSFMYGAWPHGGFGVGLERVVMLFCNLDNIRKTSLYPRDPHRLEP